MRRTKHDQLHTQVVRRRVLSILLLLGLLSALVPAGLSYAQSDATTTGNEAITALSTEEQMCLAIGMLPQNCELPPNLQQVAEEYDAAQNPQLSQAQPEPAFYTRIRPTSGDFIDETFVQVGQPLEVYTFMRNDMPYARTATISQTLNLGRSMIFEQPQLVCRLNMCSGNNGFTTGTPSSFGIGAGQYWYASYNTTTNYAGAGIFMTGLKYDQPSFPPQNFGSVAGVWALDIKSSVNGYQLHVSNPNPSLQGGNPFYYKLTLPSGVHILGAMDHGQAIGTGVWSGTQPEYLGPGDSAQLFAVLAADVAGAYDITVEVYAPDFYDKPDGSIDVRPGPVIYTANHTMTLPKYDTSLARLSFNVEEQSVVEYYPGPTIVTLKRDGNLQQSFCVEMYVDGPATFEVDWRFDSSSSSRGLNNVCFQPQVISISFHVYMIQDLVHEPVEGITFLLRPGSVSGLVVVEGKGRSSITMLDDDPQPNAALNLTTNKAELVPGDIVTLNVAVQNTSASQFGAELVLDNVLSPEMFEVLEVTGEGTGARTWFVIDGRLTIQWTFYDLAPDEVRDYQVKLRVKPGVTAGEINVAGAMLAIGIPDKPAITVQSNGLLLTVLVPTDTYRVVLPMITH